MKPAPHSNVSAKLARKSVVFDILGSESSLTASQLKARAESRGVRLSIASAYRLLAQYRKSSGNIEQTETRCTRLVANVLQGAADGEHLSVAEIECRVAALDGGLNRSTIYRALGKLSNLGCVQTIDCGRLRLYEWRWERLQHGHLTCLNCSRTIEFLQDYLYEVAREIAIKVGYDFSGIELVLKSLCPQCRVERTDREQPFDSVAE